MLSGRVVFPGVFGRILPSRHLKCMCPNHVHTVSRASASYLESLLPPWWTIWLPSNLAFLRITGSRVCGWDLQWISGISLSHMTFCSELEEFSLIGWMGTFFCLFVLVVCWEWGRPPQANNLKILHYILLFLFGFYIGSNRPITGVSVLHDIVEELKMIYSCYRQYSWTV